MKIENNLMSKINDLLLNCVEHNIIEEPYVDVVRSTFEQLMDTTDEVVLDEMYSILQQLVIKLVESDNITVASNVFMILLTSAENCTIGYLQLLIILVSMTFKKGNEILININKYNGVMAKVCAEQMAMLKLLSPLRSDQSKKGSDTEYITKVLDLQLMQL